MPLSPAAIGIILSDDETRILLVQRRDVPVWVLPGGGIEPEETPEAALIREVSEETGYRVSIQSKCAEYSPVNRLSSFTSLFKCRIDSGSASLSNETRAIAFFPIDRLPLSLFFLHAAWLKENLLSRSLIRRSLHEVSYFALLRYFLRHPLIVLRFGWTRLSMMPIVNGFQKK